MVLIWPEVGANIGVMRGASGFEKFYSEHFGERWPRLRAALQTPTLKVWLVNPFYRGELPDGAEPILQGQLPVDIRRPVEGWKRPEPDFSGFYEMDLASVLTACALPLGLGERWLDMCAAPGGKTLTKIFSHRGEVDTLANDASETRLKRLRAVLHDFIPDEKFKRIKVVHRDATRWRASAAEFDSLLIDAPCSAEHHMIGKPKYLEEWSAKRSKTLAMRQHAILCSALEFLKPGGHLLYSTCSISPFENDAVVERFIKKREGRVLLNQAPLWLGQRTSHGVEIHPDKHQSGPIYYSLLKKT